MGMMATFNVKKISLWNRTLPRAERLAADAKALRRSEDTKIKIASSPSDAVKDADIICVGTFATEPLFDLGSLRKSDPIHING